MGSPSRSPGVQGSGVPPRADARYHGDRVAIAGRLDFAVDVRAAAPPSWLVEGLSGRLGDLGRHPTESDRRRALGAPECPTVVEALGTATAGEVSG